MIYGLYGVWRCNPRKTVRRGKQCKSSTFSFDDFASFRERSDASKLNIGSDFRSVIVCRYPDIPIARQTRD